MSNLFRKGNRRIMKGHSVVVREVTEHNHNGTAMGQWYAKCECGWYSAHYPAKEGARKSHQLHIAREANVAGSVLSKFYPKGIR